MIELKAYYKAQSEAQPMPALEIAHIPVKAKSRKMRTVALAAAVFVLFSSAVALAYGSDVIERVRVTFGNSIAVQSDVIDNTPHVTLQFSILGMCEEYFMVPYGFTVFYSLDEVREVVPFAFRELPNLPEYLEFNHANVTYNEEGAYHYGVSFAFIEYIGVPFDFFAEPADNINTIWPQWNLHVSQERVGPNASLYVQSIDEIEQVIIGEVEALGIRVDGNLIRLIFIYDGTLYHLSGRLKPGDLLEIAESLVM